jgi:hypothetical protein
MKNDSHLTRLTGALVFLYSLVLYVLTVAPTASFWDCGEFIAISNRLQVSHPPGAPFYMLLGRVFSMFVPQAYISLSINLMSVVASALTVLFAFLIMVHLIEEWKGDVERWSTSDQISALGGSAIGALTFAATDSFWFNAVEAEVYALSMFFMGIVVWLIMKWSVHARHERALSGTPGRFSLGPVTSRYLVLIMYMFGLAIGIHLLNVLAIFFVALIVFFDQYDRPDWTPAQRLKGLILTGVIASLGFFVIYPGVILWLPDIMRVVQAPFLTIATLIGLIAAGLYYTQKSRMPLANVALMAFAVVLIGYSTYGLIFIRSAADPPIDENDPETLEAIVSYLKREQYGSTPIFPRMHSPMPAHQRVYAQYDSDFEFFWDYQLNHMYTRYFMWNFVGRESDEQNAAWITGFESEPVNFRELSGSEKASRNYYFALPLLLGIFGFAYHAMRDWRRAFAVGILFFVSGVGIILYLNQTPMQPRERDYSFVGSFFAFSLWIGIGASGLIELVTDLVSKRSERSNSLRTVAASLALTALLFVPAWVVVQNYDDHDRSGRYVATDYAYNLLMSVEPNAIIFTNGDNDTFPLWYMQEVEGVRQDVRVVCLSLLNTKWYIRQLRDQWSRDSAPLPMSFSDAQMEQLTVVPWQSRQVTLPVNLEAIQQHGELYIPPSESDKVESPMTWMLNGRRYNDQYNMLYVADQAALDIIVQNARQNWERPVYFANTTSRDGQLDLQEFFQAEGLAYRVVPIRNTAGLQGRVVPELQSERLSRFRYTNLDNEDVYYDENIRRMIDNYRLTFAHASEQMMIKGERDMAEATLDSIMAKVPFSVIPGDFYSVLSLARGYETVGAMDKMIETIRVAEPLLLDRLADSSSQRDIQRLIQFSQMVQFAYLKAGDYEAAAGFTESLAQISGDSTLSKTADELRATYGPSEGDGVPADSVGPDQAVPDTDRTQAPPASGE